MTAQTGLTSPPKKPRNYELKQTKELISKVNVNDITKEISTAFDYEFDGKTKFELPLFRKPKDDFNIGLIVLM